MASLQQRALVWASIHVFFLPLLVQTVRVTDVEGLDDSEDLPCEMKTVSNKEFCTVWCGIVESLVGCPEDKKSCEVFDSCTLGLRMHYNASANFANFNSSRFNFDITHWELAGSATALNDLLHKYVSGLVQPYLDMGMQKGNEIFHNLLQRKKPEIAEQITNLAVSGSEVAHKYMKYIVNDPSAAVESLVPEILANLGVDFNYHPRTPDTELEAYSEPKAMGLCHKWLKVQVGKGKPFLIKQWKHALVAKSFNIKSRCETFYVAKCHESKMTSYTRCPMKKERRKTYCIKGFMNCLFRRRSIKGRRKTPVSLRVVDENGEVKQIDTTRKRIRVNAVRVDEDSKLPVLDSPENLGLYTVIPHLPETVAIELKNVQRTLRRSFCEAGTKSKWYNVLKKLKIATCKGLVTAALHWVKFETEVPLGSLSPLPVRMEVEDQTVLRIKMVPPYEEIAAMGKEIVMKALAGVPILGSQSLQDLHIQIDGAESWVHISGHVQVGVKIDNVADLIAGENAALGAAMKVLDSIPNDVGGAVGGAIKKIGGIFR